MESIKLKTPWKDHYFVQEAFKVLRTNLQFCGQDIRVVLLTSCNENEGKSTITLNIARSFAELGKKVLVIDADLRKSVLAGRNTNVRNPKGLSEVLTGMCTVGEALYRVEESSLYVLFAGQYPPNPVELLSGKYFSTLLEECRKNFDYIFIDTPPLGRVIDAAVIAPNCDGTALVVGKNKIRYSQAQEVTEQLRKSGCRILGVIRNSVKQKKHGYSDTDRYKK